MPTSLKKGSQGPDVTEPQKLLLQRGYPVTVDGVFGTQTYRAVRAFQSQNLDQHGPPPAWPAAGGGRSGGPAYLVEPFEAGHRNADRDRFSTAAAGGSWWQPAGPLSAGSGNRRNRQGGG